MNLAMAIKAVLTQQILIGAATGQALTAVGLAGVECRGMALLAESGSTGGQQRLIDGAMRLVTQAAILRSRGMFPEEGTAFVGVAAETIVIDRNLTQRRMTNTAVGVVAVHAGGLAFRYGVTRRKMQLRAHLRVTIGANFVGFLLAQHKILLLVGVMAAVAADVLLFVLAAHPQHLVVIVVAGLATRITHGDIRGPIRTETDIRGVSAGFLFMGSAGAVAGYAAVVTPPCQRSMDGIGNGMNRLIILVAGEALAFSSRRICAGGPCREHDKAAEKSYFSLDSSHCY